MITYFQLRYMRYRQDHMQLDIYTRFHFLKLVLFYSIEALSLKDYS